MRAQAAWTTPGLMSMLSGLNPPAHGATQRGARLSAQAQTLPTLFRRAGYDVPNVCYQTGEPSFTDLGYEPAAMDSGVGVESLQAVLRQERGRSFFIWYHYREVHLPYLPPLPYLNMFADSERWSAAQQKRLAVVQRRPIIPIGTARFLAQDHEAIKALYDASVRKMDDEFGAVLDTLKDLGLERNTLVILSADHGEELFEHGWIGHASTAARATLYEEVLRIPLIVAGAAWFEGSRRVTERVRQIDMFPTVVELLGLPRRAGPCEGRSLVPLLRGEKLPPVSSYAETSLGGYRTRSGEEVFRVRCILDGTWKLVESLLPGGRRVELYNLERDAAERYNFARGTSRSANRVTKRGSSA